MTTKHAAWLALHTPASTLALATAMNLDYRLVANAVSSLRDTGHVELVRQIGRERIYVACRELLPEGRGHSPGSANGRALGPLTRPRVIRMTTPHEQRHDGARARGYGSGKIALEEVWR